MEVTNPHKGGSGGAVDVVVSLPEDIIFDVLTRLPAKVLSRFRCVSKSWRALIADPAFIAAQRSRAAPLLVGVFWPRRRVAGSKFELRVTDMDGGVVRAFEGVSELLAPTSARLDLICAYRLRGGAVVIDPATGRSLAIGGEHKRSVIGTAIPTLIRYGFGRAAGPSGAYKVLRIHNEEGSHDQVWEIATIKRGGAEPPPWRQMAAPPFRSSYSRDHTATVNGTLYFVHGGRIGDAPDPGRGRIAAFNLESEEWEETIIDCPAMEVKVGEFSSYALAELKETLCIVQKVGTLAYNHNEGYGYGRYTNIWVLIDSKKSIWVKQYTIRQTPKDVFVIRVLGILDDGRILLLNGLDYHDREKNIVSHWNILQSYDPSTEAFTDVMKIREEFCAMAFYTGSLLS